jgi:hypothetical protein
MQGSPATKEGGAPTVMPAESLAPTGVPARRVIQLCAESRLGQAWLQATDSNRKLAEQREIAVGGQEGLYAMCDASGADASVVNDRAAHTWALHESETIPSNLLDVIFEGRPGAPHPPASKSPSQPLLALPPSVHSARVHASRALNEARRGNPRRASVAQKRGSASTLACPSAWTSLSDWVAVSDWLGVRRR